MVSSITQDPYSIIISLNLASSVNLNIGAPPRPTELPLVGIRTDTSSWVLEEPNKARKYYEITKSRNFMMGYFPKLPKVP